VSTIAFVGKINSGKSSLLNALLETRLLPADVMVCTHKMAIVHYGEQSDCRVIFKNGSVKLVKNDLGKLQKYNDDIEKVRYLRVSYPNERFFKRHSLAFIDTPGTNIENVDDDDARRAGIQFADGVIFVTSEKSLSQREKRLIDQLINEKKINNLIVVLNKIDLLLDNSKRSTIRKAIEKDLKKIRGVKNNGVDVIPLSALDILNQLSEKQFKAETPAELQPLVDWIISISPPIDQMRSSMEDDSISMVIRDAGIWEQILSNFQTFTIPHVTPSWLSYVENSKDPIVHIHSLKDWDESVYDETGIDNISGFSVPVFDGSVFVSCILQRKNRQLNYRTSFLFREFDYRNMKGKLMYLRSKHELQFRTYNGYYEIYTEFPQKDKSSKLTILEISELIERVLK